MGARNALATPTDVFPRNGNVVVFDENDEFPFSFTNWCDALAYFALTVYDAVTNEQVRELVAYTFNPNTEEHYTYQRGDTINSYMGRIAFDDPNTELKSGHHYKYKITLYSCLPNESGGYANIPNCVVPYASGITFDRYSGHHLSIGRNIANCKAPSYWGDSGMIIGCSMLRIGNEERMVTRYEPETGYVWVDRDFTFEEPITDEKRFVPYTLYCNYISTNGNESEGSYDFYVREGIGSTTSAKLVPLGLRIKNTYQHPNNVGLENYRMKVYQLDSDSVLSGYTQSSDLTSLTSVKIATGITQNLIGRNITFALSSGTISGDVNDGYKSTIIGYNYNTGMLYLNQPLPVMITENTKYTIDLSSPVLIGDSDSVYNYHLHYSFPIYPYGETYQMETTLTTYEKQQLTLSKKFILSDPELDSVISGSSIVIDVQNQNVNISVLQDSTTIRYPFDGYNIFRKDSDKHLWNYIGFMPIIEGQNTIHFTDYTAGNNSEYDYSFVRGIADVAIADYDPAINYKPYNIESVQTKWDGWTITALHPFKDYVKNYIESDPMTLKDTNILTTVFAKTPYVVGETWHFLSAINSGDITTNLGINVHVGTSAYPTITRTKNKYQTGSFTAHILELECPSTNVIDNIDKVKRWDKFINDDCLFILRSDKGDVWVIAISENTSRSYDESVEPILTTASYSWTEVCKAEDIQIIQFDVL